MTDSDHVPINKRRTAKKFYATNFISTNLSEMFQRVWIVDRSNCIVALLIVECVRDSDENEWFIRHHENIQKIFNTSSGFSFGRFDFGRTWFSIVLHGQDKGLVYGWWILDPSFDRICTRESLRVAYVSVDRVLNRKTLF